VFLVIASILETAAAVAVRTARHRDSGGMMDLMFGRRISQPSEADAATFRETGRENQDDAPTWAWRLLSVAPLGGAAAAAVFVTGGFPLWVPILLAVLGVTALLAPPCATRAATLRTLPVAAAVLVRVVRVFYSSPP
jgi:hypothetical protein